VQHVHAIRSIPEPLVHVDRPCVDASAVGARRRGGYSVSYSTWAWIALPVSSIHPLVRA
jgi:hypothetical protein